MTRLLDALGRAQDPVEISRRVLAAEVEAEAGGWAEENRYSPETVLLAQALLPTARSLNDPTVECDAADCDRVRSYVIGLPVVITVHPDGKVTAEVDLSEASDVWDASTPEGQDDDEDTLIADKEAIDTAVEEKRVAVSA